MIICSAGLLVKLLSVCLNKYFAVFFEKDFCCSIIGWKFFSFSTLKISLYLLSVMSISDQKSAIILIFFSRRNVVFFLWWLLTFSLYHWKQFNYAVLYLDVLFMVILLGLIERLGSGFIIFIKFGKIAVIISSTKFFCSLSFSF